MLKILGIALRIEKAVAAIAYVIVAGLLLGDVIAREVFFDSIWGAQKMAVFAAIIAGFLGLTLATAANGHLRPQFTDHWWPDRMQPSVSRFGDILSALLFAAMAYISVLYVIVSFENQDRAAVLYWFLWPIQIVIPYAFGSSALRHAAFAIWPECRPVPDLTEG